MGGLGVPTGRRNRQRLRSVLINHFLQPTSNLIHGLLVADLLPLVFTTLAYPFKRFCQPILMIMDLGRSDPFVADIACQMRVIVRDDALKFTIFSLSSELTTDIANRAHCVILFSLDCFCHKNLPCLFDPVFNYIPSRNSLRSFHRSIEPRIISHKPTCPDKAGRLLLSEDKGQVEV